MQRIFLFIIFAAATILGSTAEAVEQWGVFEVELRAAEAPHTMDSPFAATFSQGDRNLTVAGFWDGSDAFKCRFSPPTSGEWTFATHSKYKSLDGKTGTLTVKKPSGGNRGPVQVFNTFYLRHADDTPYHQFGTTCYAWVHQTNERQKQTLKTLAASPFNKIRFCVFPKSYIYNQNEPDFFAFKKDSDGKFDFTQPDPEFWRHFEQRIVDLQNLGLRRT